MKTITDIYYKDVLEKYGKDGLIEAGYFENNIIDNLKIEDTLDIKCTPILFILNRLSSTKKPCVLLSTGAFCPIHNGHLAMMEGAKKAVEKAGWNVIGGYISPDHDEYINRKISERDYDINKRIKLINNSIINSDWLRVDPWAGLFLEKTVNFTDILTRLEAYILKHIGQDIPIFLVAGEDNAGFVLTFEKQGHCVIVTRPGHENKINKYERLFDGKRLIKGVCEVKNSSTEVRKTLRKERSVEKELLLRMEEETPLTLAICDILSKYFSKVKIQKVNEQRKTFNETFDTNTTISLDPSIKSKYNLEISRNYDLFGMNMLGFTNRPGSKSLQEQIRNIPRGTYSLFDDDIHTGKTMRYVSTLLEKEGINIWAFDTFTRSKENQEVLDIRDFIFNSKDGGLVINNVRYPYIYPFVNSYIRASINKPLEFSCEIQKVNNDYRF